MPRFHFNVYDGVGILDKVVTELPNWQTARIEAILLMGSMLKDEVKRIALSQDWRLEVTDHTGLILFEIRLEMIEGAAERQSS